MKLPKLSMNIQYLIVFIFGALILIVYGSNIKNIYTVWQIGDEAGYLMNAAFFTGHDWSSIYEVIPYYGYGYSLLLIPLFVLFDTGIEIIRGAIFINILCVVITYFIQIIVMKTIIGDCRFSILAFMSFTVCFYPYMAGETYQVIAESFLVMLFWLSILLICMALKKQSKYLYILYGMCIAYMFFVHARAIVVVMAAFATVFLCILCKKIKLEHIISFICGFVSFFIIGYFMKNYIIGSIYAGVSGDGVLKDRNIITIKYIVDRLKWLFNLKNIKLYIYGFFAKVFYLMVSTAIMAVVGIISITKNFNNLKKLNSEQSISVIYIFLSFFLMFLASCVNGTGMSENFTYFFYGRYFEYTVMPIIFIGLYASLFGEIRIKKVCIILFGIIVSGIITSNIITFLDSDEIHIDAYRIAGFANGVKKNDNFESLIFYLILSTVFVTVLIFLFHHTLKFKTVILLLVLIYFFNSSTVCIDAINTTNQNSLKDSEIAEYINNRETDNYVYFINDEFRYYGFYSRMQILMPEIHIKVIQANQLEQLTKDSLAITYKEAPSDVILSEIEEPLLKGNMFNLYEIR